MKKWLVLDVDNLMHRSFHAMPPLEVKGRQTGAIHGFLKSLIQLRATYEATNLAFCFDRGVPKRKEFYSSYQSRRDVIPPYKANKDRKYLKRQLSELRDYILPDLGMSNVFSVDGYEADDLIAALVNSYAVKRGVIVSSDKDLYQCLRGGISVHDLDSKIEITEEKFKERYQVTPQEWITVKAIAGCDSDSIFGIKGVAEKTAIRYIKGELGPTFKSYVAIQVGRAIIERNRKLIELPWPGLKLPDLYEDSDTSETWGKVLQSLNMGGVRV